jgi:hypothetical protein
VHVVLPPHPLGEEATDVGHRSGQSDLVALHHDGRTARGTIERLSRAGVDGGAIELLGPVEVVTAGRYADRQTDRGSSLAVGGRALRGLVWGLVPGGVFGAVLLSLTTSPSVAAVASGAGGGAFFGAGVGVLTALLTIPTMASSWERTFSPMVPGGVAVGIRVEDPRTAKRAARVLRVCAAHEVREVRDLDDLPPGRIGPQWFADSDDDVGGTGGREPR